ncbi:HAD family hydrolase [Saccharomonospora iraqiensis]|uniref:HAD family hydrolase n=1 Tax=Saccharomonospora iraqiensis TaxID=52698 RepID=UPI00022E0EA5|nr:hypothetical protein [Saccharomonospora iraqiensis]
MRLSPAFGSRRAENRRQLEYLHRVLNDGACPVLSLDIFDTVLWRRVPHPADLFGILGARLRRAGVCPPWLTDTSFRRMRVAAEHDARGRSESLGGEVSLFDIWNAMPLSLFDGTPLDDLVRTEVEVERVFTVADLDMADVLRLAEKYEVPIVLVSDTYFTEKQLAYLLDRPELDTLRDARVFRSQQHGAAKESGLWTIVLNELGCSPEQVVHVGDNARADHVIPASLGVRTVPYQRIDEDFADVLEREQESAETFGPFGAHIDPEHGDFGLTSLRARTLGSAPSPTSAAVGTAWRYGASVLGPVLTGFAEWVAFQAHRCGTPVVWCPMREGELLAHLVNQAARSRDWKVEAKTLWLSRQVTSIASLDCFDRDSVREFVRKSYRLTVSRLLATLHLRPGDVPGLAGELDTVLDHDDVVDRVSEVLTETPHLRNRLAVAVTAARERLLRALHDSGALDSPELVLVDLGWGGTIQLQLAQTLRIVQSGTRVSGLYLATDERSTRLHHAGLPAAGYLGQAGQPHETVEAVRRSPEVIEQCTNALCGSLVDFTDEGSPVLGPRAGSESQDAEIRSTQDGILAFQRQWNRYVEHSGGTWPALTDSARHRLATILTAALKCPTTDEAAVFGNWAHDDNFGSSVVTRILPEDLRPAVPYLSPNDLDDLGMRDAFWPALIAASDTRLSAAARALANGLVDPGMFEPAGEPSETRLRFRTPDEKWHDGPRRRVRINHNGLSFARMDFETDGATDVSLAIPGRPAIVRVDWIEATVIAGGDAEPRVLRWDKPDDFAGLTFAECTWLGANMVEFGSPHAALWLPLADRAGAPVTSARITIAFAMLPQWVSGFTPRVPPASRLARLSGRARTEYRARGVAGIAAGAARMVIRRLAARG